MNRRFAKTVLILAIGLLCWMVVRAFQPGRPRAEVVAEPDNAVRLAPEELAPIETAGANGQSPAAPILPADTQPKRLASVPPTESAVKPLAPADKAPPSAASSKAGHEQHASKSDAVPKPKRKPVDPAVPIAFDGLGRAQLDWDSLATTRIDAHYKPTFTTNLENLDGESVVLSGFMSPLDEVGAVTVFLLVEFPIGCFYCQTPEPTGIVLVELAAGKQSAIHSSLVKVTGKLTLNRDDPEDFLYIVTDADVTKAD